jgi:hypothetical protein
VIKAIAEPVDSRSPHKLKTKLRRSPTTLSEFF